MRHDSRLGRGVALAAVLVAGLSTPSWAQESTLSIGTWMWNEPGIGEWWQLAAKKFEEENPGVTLEVRNLPVNEYMTQIVVELASGNPADVVSVSSNLPELQGSGGLVPLNDFIEQSGMTRPHRAGLPRPRDLRRQHHGDPARRPHAGAALQ